MACVFLVFWTSFCSTEKNFSVALFTVELLRNDNRNPNLQVVIRLLSIYADAKKVMGVHLVAVCFVVMSLLHYVLELVYICFGSFDVV